MNILHHKHEATDRSIAPNTAMSNTYFLPLRSPKELHHPTLAKLINNVTAAAPAVDSSSIRTTGDVAPTHVHFQGNPRYLEPDIELS
jgi:hypothetical protein